MRFVAILGVKDEAELLPKVISHLFTIGVDRIIVRDNASTDGSSEYLHSQAGERLVLEPLAQAEVGSDETWAAREAQLARESGADWVIFLDADEFWLPASGSLHACTQFADQSIDVLRVPRYNVPLVAGEPCIPESLHPASYANLELVARAPANDFRSYLEQHPAAAWITGVPVPKVAVRPHRIGALHPGHHRVDPPDGVPLKRAVADGLVIAHLPFTTVSRFERKVRNIRDLLGAYDGIFPGHGAWHWKRWAAMQGSEALVEEFARQSLSAGDFRNMKASGTIRNAAQLLETNRP